MEVYLGNVPKHLADRALTRELRPFMNALGILDWRCSTNFGRTAGFITFLYVDDGTKFLRRHGKIPLPMQADTTSVKSTNPVHHDPKGQWKRLPKRFDEPRLFLLSNRTAIFASESKSKPDPFMLKSLELQREERSSREVTQSNNRHVTGFSSREVHCGHLVLPGSEEKLSFVSQCSLQRQSSVKFTKTSLIVRFEESGDSLRVAYDTVENMVVKTATSSAFFTFVLNEAPRFYLSRSSQDESLVRTTHLPGCPDHETYVPYCLVYQLSVWGDDLHQRIAELKARKLVTMSHTSLEFITRPAPCTEDFSTANVVFQQALSDCARQNALSFSMLFKVQALVWNNYLHPHVARRLLLHIKWIFREARLRHGPDPISIDAMKSLYGSIPFPYPGMTPEELDPQKLLDQLLHLEKRARQGALLASNDPPLDDSNRTWIFKATVTPTRITLHGPDLEPMNRILRKYPGYNDYFMRVQFCDESGDDIFMSPKVSHTHIFDRYRNVLTNGIQIAGRVYGFLGFSHSSLRSHSAWLQAPFYYEDELQTYDMIIRGLGDFDRIRIPAKCAARIGQAFSETPFYVSLTECNISYRYIPDVKSADGQRVFSDGVGTISREALEAIWPRLPRLGNTLPTCLQIRWAGVKGMLSLDATIPGRVMSIREESMVKFPSRDTTNLEICDTASKPLRLVLNRPLIKVMEDHQVDPQWFLDLQKRELDRLRAVTADAYNTSTFLQLQGIGTNFYLSTFIKTLDRYDIDYREDDFLRTVVESVVLRELRLLKHKARIPVPKGVTLFGVMDETGFLQEREVYVCYDSFRRPGKAPIENTLADGWIMVTRSPAMHPGDVQHVRMRTPPTGHPLRELRNCIVFSRRGDRDLPSQLGGGDLDGDLYNIIWDRRAFPSVAFEPADYPRVSPGQLNRPVERQDMADWFVDFMKSDVLGMIATRHLILSDLDEEGTNTEGCLKLAAMHSTAVDFSKTGIPVVMSEMPRTKRYRPDL